MKDEHDIEIVKTIPMVTDIFLQVLANICTQDENNAVGLTVISGGKEISGNCVHRNKWLQQLQGLASSGSAVAVLEGMEMSGRSLDAEIAAKAETDPDYEPPQAGWLNFVDAHVDGAEFGPMRVQLSSVTAWSPAVRR